MTANLQAQSDNGSRQNGGIFVAVLWFFAGYWALSCLAIPFVGRLWLGEIPVLAIIQMPMIVAAQWLRIHVVMEIIKFLGCSRGSFSPDYILARPYALALAYLLTVVIICGIGRYFRFHFTDERHRFVIAAFLVTAIADYLFILIFAAGPGFTIYA
jgi:hypothetical protein